MQNPVEDPVVQWDFQVISVAPVPLQIGVVIDNWITAQRHNSRFNRGLIGIDSATKRSMKAG